MTELLRPEVYGFCLGVDWVALHLRVAAENAEKDTRDHSGAIVKSGRSDFAAKLRELADALESAAPAEARRLWPDFDPLPPSSKAGQSSGF